MDAAEIAWEDCIASLPPLASLSSPSSDLPTPDLLSLLSPAPASPSKPASALDATLISASLDAPPLSHCTSSTHSQTSSPPLPCSPKPDPLNELNERLVSSIAESKNLRRRVAALVEQNRSLRAALDHANARLLAVAQAAAAPVPQHVQIAEEGRERKKRKRVSGAAATTMACVMFMWGALMGGVREGGNLPVVWEGDAGAVRRWQGACGRGMGELPKGEEEEELSVGEGYGYVLCREIGKAAESVRECERRMEMGEMCGLPHTLSLIVPAEGRNGSDVGLAEVVCSIESVARVQDVDSGRKKGKVIAQLKEEKMEE